MESFTDLISITDLVGCAIVAFLGTLLIKNLPFLVRLKKDETEFMNNVDFARVLDKCYTLFPLDSLRFHGKTFTRGMYLKITTIGEKTIEGQFIGANHENVLCIMTEKAISAEILENISGITIIESK